MQHLTELSCWNSLSWNQIHEELAMVHVILWVLELALSFSSYAGCVEKKKSVASPLPTGYSESLITPLRNCNLKWTSSKTISNIKFEGVMGHLISQHLSYLCHSTLFCSNRWLILKSSVWDSLLLKFTRHKHHTWTLWAPFSLIAYYPVKALNCRDFQLGQHIYLKQFHLDQGIESQFLETCGSQILSGQLDKVVNFDALVTNISEWPTCTCFHVQQASHSFITKYLLNNYSISGAIFDA